MGHFPFVAASPVLFPGPRKTGIGNGESPSEGGLSRPESHSKLPTNTWTSAIRWSDTSFQDNQQLFGSIILLKHTHKHRERERETYRQEKSIKNPLPPLGGLLKSVTWVFMFVTFDLWHPAWWLSIWALRRLLWVSQSTGAVFAVAQYLCLPAWRPETVSDLARWLPFCQIRVPDSSRIKQPCSNKTTPRLVFRREPKMGIHQSDSRTW